jgi:hypothetical protein
MSKTCLSNGGKHRWKYGDDSMLGRVRNCQGCGAIEQKESTTGKWRSVGSTRWVPLTPAERERGTRMR